MANGKRKEDWDAEDYITELKESRNLENPCTPENHRTVVGAVVSVTRMVLDLRADIRKLPTEIVRELRESDRTLRITGPRGFGMQGPTSVVLLAMVLLVLVALALRPLWDRVL